jgi:hypothetical protein
MRRLLPALFALLAVLAAMPAEAEGEGNLRRFAARLDLAGKGEGNAFIGAAEARLAGTIARDVWIGGAVVEVLADIGDDLHAYGATVDISGAAGGDVSAWAAKATVSAPRVGDDLDLNAATVHVAEGTAIAGETRISGSEVSFAGTGAGRIDIKGQTVVFSGAAAGLVEIVATKVRIASSARLKGGLSVFTIGEPEIEPGAMIEGGVVRRSLYEAPVMQPYLQGELMQSVRLALILGASGLVAGVAFLLFGRGGVEDSVDALIEHTGRSALWGIGTIFVLPLAAAILALSFVGIPLAAAILLALPVLLLLGFASAGFGVGEWLFNRAGVPIPGRLRGILLMAGLAALMLLTLLPYAGLPLVGLASLVGLGAFMRTLYARMHESGLRPE